jgi:hypothetical protein
MILRAEDMDNIFSPYGAEAQRGPWHPRFLGI